MKKDVFIEAVIEKEVVNMSEIQKKIYSETVLKLSKLPDELFEKVWDCSYATLGRKSVVCCMILRNGFEIITNATPVREEDCDFNLGMKLAKFKAFEKLIEMEVYRKYVESHDECIFEETENNTM